MAGLEDLGIQAASLLVSAMSGGRRAFRVPQRHIWRAAPRRRRTRPGCRGRDRATPRRAGPTSDCSAPSRAPARSDAIAPTLAGGAGPGCPPGAGRLTGVGPRGRRSGEMSTVLQYSRVRVGASGRPPADGSTLSADGSLSSGDVRACRAGESVCRFVRPVSGVRDMRGATGDRYGSSQGNLVQRVTSVDEQATGG
jgi:hypothetical protein